MTLYVFLIFQKNFTSIYFNAKHLLLLFCIFLCVQLQIPIRRTHFPYFVLWQTKQRDCSLLKKEYPYVHVPKSIMSFSICQCLTNTNVIGLYKVYLFNFVALVYLEKQNLTKSRKRLPDKKTDALTNCINEVLALIQSKISMRSLVYYRVGL